MLLFIACQTMLYLIKFDSRKIDFRYFISIRYLYSILVQFCSLSI